MSTQLAITKRMYSAGCDQIKCAVSIVHKCNVSCMFDLGHSSRRAAQERRNRRGGFDFYTRLDQYAMLLYCVCEVIAARF